MTHCGCTRVVAVLAEPSRGEEDEGDLAPSPSSSLSPALALDPHTAELAMGDDIRQVRSLLILPATHSKAHPLPSLPQALLQLQQRGQDASRSLSAVRAQLNARERDSKVTTLTLREIELLPREPGGATCYRGVGRMSVPLSPSLSLVSAPRSLTCALPLTAGSSKNRATTSRTRCAHRPRTPRTTSPSSTRRQRCVLGELSASPVCTSMS